MTAKTKFKSDAFEAIHASAQALHKLALSIRPRCAPLMNPALLKRQK